jgi:transcription elongation factor Elf1
VKLSETAKLLPCPFCGADAVVETILDEPVRYSVGCCYEGDGSCYGAQSLVTFATLREAIDGWNKRAK